MNYTARRGPFGPRVGVCAIQRVGFRLQAHGPREGVYTIHRVGFRLQAHGPRVGAYTIRLWNPQTFNTNTAKIQKRGGVSHEWSQVLDGISVL